jgi:predicted dehydrogenase
MKALLIGPENPHFAGHLRTLQILHEVTQISICCSDTDDEVLLNATVAENAPKVTSRFRSVDEALVANKYDFVLGCPRNDRAIAVYAKVFSHRLPALAEKPLGRNAQEAQLLCDLAEKAGVVLGVCYQNRYNPVVQYARDFIQNGLLGKLMQVHTRYVTTNIAARDPNHWLFNRSCIGGGILQWLGCHHLDLARYVAGEEIVHVSGHTGTLNGHAINVEDTATLSYRFASGAIGGMHCVNALAQSGGGYYNQAGNDTVAMFIGTLGRLVWSPTETPIVLRAESIHPTWSASPRRTITFEMGESPAYGGKYGEAFVRDFIRAATADAAPPASGRDALAVQKIIDSVYVQNA